MPLSPSLRQNRLVVDRDAAHDRSAQHAPKQLRLRCRQQRIVLNPAGQERRCRDNYPPRVDRQPIGENFHSGVALLDRPDRRRELEYIAKLRGQANSQFRRAAVYQVRLGIRGVDVIFKASAAASEHE